ncbi:MAG: carbohydrate ABC transporter permease [Chloroflexi bacterium HGW-Chloroflexi-10]|nr:MAG: carbohydrate ABC transporter permease [Chloroflexi bacterium HGW-Chloroflexi-10]
MRFSGQRWIWSSVIGLTALISLFPLYWLWLGAFNLENTQALIRPIWFFQPSLQNIQNILAASGRTQFVIPFLNQGIEIDRLWLWMFNSAGLAIAATLLHLFFDSMAAYMFARHQFPGRRILFAILIVSLMLPQQITLVPLYILLVNWGLQNSLIGVLLPGLADGIGIFLLRQFMRSLPGNIEDAARLDGASEWVIYRHVIIPLSIPGLAALAIFVFQSSWNQFVLPLILLQKSDTFTLQVGLAYLYQSEFGIHYSWLMAGSFFSIIPILIVFFGFQKYLEKGLQIISYE